MLDRLSTSKSLSIQVHSYQRCHHSLITLLFWAIVGLALSAIIYYGLSKHFASKYFIFSSVIIPFAFFGGVFSIYRFFYKPEKQKELIQQDVVKTKELSLGDSIDNKNKDSKPNHCSESGVEDRNGETSQIVTRPPLPREEVSQEQNVKTKELSLSDNIGNEAVGSKISHCSESGVEDRNGETSQIATRPPLPREEVSQEQNVKTKELSLNSNTDNEGVDSKPNHCSESEIEDRNGETSQIATRPPLPREEVSQEQNVKTKELSLNSNTGNEGVDSKPNHCSESEIEDRNGETSQIATRPPLPREEVSQGIVGYRWKHLELGCANYGEKGHSTGEVRGGHVKQLQPLYTTIDILVREKGLLGTLFLNDLEESACKYTAKLVKNYIKGNYPEADIAIKIIAKSYREINVPCDLEVEYLDSIHLKNPDYYQLESDIENRGWINTLLQYSPELMIVSAYCGLHGASIMERHLLQGGEKSEPIESLRYVREANPDPTYLYVHPDGSYNPGWELCTYHYFIRQARQEELYTQEEMEVRNLKKAEITESIREVREEFIVYYKRFQKEVLEHPDYLLLSTFTAHCNSCKYYLNLFANTLHEWETEYFCKLSKDRKLDDVKWHDYFYRTKCEDTKNRLENYINVFTVLDMPLKTVSSDIKGGDEVYYMNFLSRIRYGNLDPAIIWEQLGLKEAYKALFPYSNDFWSSPYSLKKIHKQLCEYKKHHTV